MSALLTPATIIFRMFLLAAMLMGPIGAMAYSKAANLGVGKQGAGLVLFVTLQRQSMS
ncbi:hypothetical protein QO002_001844 [Pararhizobium capsulatum DSM 1112]|uniref:Uncharacterized protein n=1 Tax=Pararhizobium capsulatum DSM 1112 TaxID=1121113 RepID=A0ABU0BN73_9HYPH|nr:hypothetical protein [Pararhizobium capsulatum]MDQ0319706.1 hypothetical protein [Pararhizobium capsulatum DSM 1112]